MIVDLVPILSTIAAAIAAFFSFLQGRTMARSERLRDQQGKTTVLLEVADRWTDILQVRYRVRANIENYRNPQERYRDIREFMASEDWQHLRVLCNFYEFLGMLVYYKIMSISTVLVLVTVDESDFDAAKPSIDWLRSEYRDDIYLFWDWLILAARKRQATNPFKKNRVPNL